jgi:hypothetical protein
MLQILKLAVATGLWNDATDLNANENKFFMVDVKLLV